MSIATTDPNPEQIGLPELSAYIEQTLSANMTRDPFTAARHLEHMHVAISYVHEYFECRGRRPSLFALAVLDGDAVADRIASDLDQEAKARIAHSVTLLVEHARKLLDETTVTPDQILDGTPRVSSISADFDQPGQYPEPTAEPSFLERLPIIIHLTLNLTSFYVDFPSGDEPIVAPR